MNRNIKIPASGPMLKVVRRIAIEHEATVTETISHKERVRRLESIWTIVDRDKARVGKRVTRAMAYQA